MTTTRSSSDPDVVPAEAAPAGALPVPPPTLLSRGISAAGIMLVATVITNATNYAYSLLMGRQLGPELFGEFTALLGVLMILSVASQTVQTVVARYVTGIHTNQGPAAVVDFARRLMWRLTLVGVVAFLVWIPISFPLASVLQIDSPVPVIAAGSALILGFSLPVVWGAFQGEQRFRHLGSNMCALAIGRFVLGAVLVVLGASVAGAIGALSVATAFAFVLAYPSVRAGPGIAPARRASGPRAGRLRAADDARPRRLDAAHQPRHRLRQGGRELDRGGLLRRGGDDRQDRALPAPGARPGDLPEGRGPPRRRSGLAVPDAPHGPGRGRRQRRARSWSARSSARRPSS